MPESAKQRLADRISSAVSGQGLSAPEKWNALPDKTRSLIDNFKSGEVFPIDYTNGKFSDGAIQVAELLSTTPEQLFGFDETAYNSALGTLKAEQRAALILKAGGNSDENIAYAVGKTTADIPRLVEFAKITISHRCDTATKLRKSFSQEALATFLSTGKTRSDDIFLNFWPRLQNRTKQMKPDVFATALETFVRISTKRPELSKFSVIGIADQQLLDDTNTALRAEVSAPTLARVLKCFEALERRPSRPFLAALEKSFKADPSLREHLKNSPFCQNFAVKPAPAPQPSGEGEAPHPP